MNRRFLKFSVDPGAGDSTLLGAADDGVGSATEAVMVLLFRRLGKNKER